MRSDMAKLLSERSRQGRGWTANNGSLKPFRKTEPEDWWSKERMKDRWSGGFKYSSVRLGPLRRFLRSNVGRPWDLVFSEICREVRDQHGARQRLLEHLDRFVDRFVILVEGVPCHGPGHLHGTPLTNYGQRYFYVCPASGLLRIVPDRRKKRR